MKISKDNYEAFFLDYHEGNLSDAMRREVLAFVASNPELREEFESFEIISLGDKTDMKFPGKEKLKKDTVNEYNYKTWLVAYVEGDLDGREKREVENFIEANSLYKREFEILKQAKITPDYSIRFAGKSSLKKGGIVIPMWVRIAAAACLVIGLLGYWMIQRKSQPELVHENPLQKSIPVPEAQKPAVEKIKMLAADQQEMNVKNNSIYPIQKPLRKNMQEIKPRESLADKDPAPVVEQPLAEHHDADIRQDSKDDHQPAMVINENKSQPALQNQKLVVLDDNDLAELGLKEKTTVEDNSLLADAVNGVGKLFGVNAHYDKEHNLLQSKYTETLALGPLAVTRTVSR